MDENPIFTQSDPAEMAQRFKQRLLALDCSEQYAEEARRDLLARTVQTHELLEGNAILCARTRVA